MRSRWHFHQRKTVRWKLLMELRTFRASCTHFAALQRSLLFCSASMPKWCSYVKQRDRQGKTDSHRAWKSTAAFREKMNTNNRRQQLSRRSRFYDFRWRISRWPGRGPNSLRRIAPIDSREILPNFSGDFPERCGITCVYQFCNPVLMLFWSHRAFTAVENSSVFSEFLSQELNETARNKRSESCSVLLLSKNDTFAMFKVCNHDEILVLLCTSRTFS